MIGKVVVTGISLILVVGVVFGIVAGINRHSNASTGVSSTSSPAMKAVTSICAPTDYKDVCVNSLKTTAQNSSVTSKDLVKAAVDATITEVRSAMLKAGELAPMAGNDSRERMAIGDCKDLLQFAVDELQASFSLVGDSDMHSLADRTDELKNWISAVISYQQSCLDGLSTPQFQKSMGDQLANATRLTSNALAIVSEISDIVKSLVGGLKIDGPGRRLLGKTEVDKEGLPVWFSRSDRKLVGSGGVLPNAVVAKDGSGGFKTIMGALAAYPKDLKGRYVIYVKTGIYDEEVLVDKTKVNVYMYGDGPRKTIVTGKKSFATGYSTFKTASFAVIGNGFVARAMGFTNTAGPDGHQAVALRVQSDMSAFFNCRMDGYQDTLYVQTHRQFYRNCVISGTVDFIFGDSATLIQNSLIIVRKPNPNQQNTVTAHGRSDRRETTGLVIHNCRIVPEQKLFGTRLTVRSFLGRPWKEYSRTVIMESTLGDFIQPDGYMPWSGDFALNTLYYGEFGNRGPGAATDGRVKWRGFHVINRQEAMQFTAGPFLQGNLWLRFTGAPFQLGLFK